MFGFSIGHVIILLVIIFLFGGKRLPELGAGLGKGLRAFKKGLSGLTDDDGESKSDPEKITHDDDDNDDPEKIDIQVNASTDADNQADDNQAADNQAADNQAADNQADNNQDNNNQDDKNQDNKNQDSKS